MKQTLADIRAALREADREGFEALACALEGDERKGVQQALAAARRRLDAEDVERARLDEMYAFQARLAAGGIAVGLDEVGRGPVAGPLTVAAVVLPDDARIEGLNDSKQIRPEKREQIAVEVKNRPQPGRSSISSPRSSMSTAWLRRCGPLSRVRSRRSKPQGAHIDCVLLDGNAMGLDPRERNVVKGDAKCASIAAASIIAKVERDALMRAYGKRLPEYGSRATRVTRAPSTSPRSSVRLARCTARRFAAPGRRTRFSSIMSVFGSLPEGFCGMRRAVRRACAGRSRPSRRVAETDKRASGAFSLLVFR